MRRFSLTEVIPDIEPVRIVDIGAMLLGDTLSVGGNLVERGLAEVVGFEPNISECDKLNARFGPKHSFYPNFIGDGRKRTFYETNVAMTGSLYPPNTELVNLYHGLGELMRLVAEHPVDTTRLDDLEGLGEIDFIKMDVQGAEVDVIRGGKRVFADALVVQAETSFIELYKGQALLGDLDCAMRAEGFAFHWMEPVQGRVLKPMVLSNTSHTNRINQFMWTDCVYTRPMIELPKVPVRRLKKLALILHDVFGSIDVVLYILKAIDEATGTRYMRPYLESFAPKPAAPTFKFDEKAWGWKAQ